MVNFTDGIGGCYKLDENGDRVPDVPEPPPAE